MPGRATVGERLSAVEATLKIVDEYQHERWHKLANDLQPIINLPLQITRDIAKMQGSFDGKVNAMTREIDRSITTAIEKALAPINDELIKLKTDVATLQAKQNAWTGAKLLMVWIIQTAIAAVVAVVAIESGKH